MKRIIPALSVMLLALLLLMLPVFAEEETQDAGSTEVCAHEQTRELYYFDAPYYEPLDAENHRVSGRAVVQVVCEICGQELSVRDVDNAEEICRHVFRKGQCVLCGWVNPVPEQTLTPEEEPDLTPEPGEEPDETPGPEEEPEEEPDETPETEDEPDETPEPEEEPDETPEPEEEPDETPEPKEEPDVTPEPEEEPDETPEPEEEPDVTPEPEEEPDETPEPEEEPDVTPEPEEEPDVTPEPEEEPDVTPEPEEEPDETPEPEAEPDVTPIPEKKPDPTPIPQKKTVRTPVPEQETILTLTPVEGDEDRYTCTLTNADLSAAKDTLVLRPKGREAALALQADELREEIDDSGSTITAEIENAGNQIVNASVCLNTADGEKAVPAKHQVSLRIYKALQDEPLTVSFTDPEGNSHSEQADWVRKNGEGYWSVPWRGNGNYEYGTAGGK